MTKIITSIKTIPICLTEHLTKIVYMCVHVCVCMCVCVCMHASVYAHTCVCMHMYVCRILGLYFEKLGNTCEHRMQFAL